MNTTDAAHHTVHDYPGGSESLGPRVDISAAVLRSKVNISIPRNQKRHHLSFDEAQRIVAATGDYRMLKAWANESGFLLVKAPDACTTESDMSVLEQTTGFMVACGAFGKEIYDSLADGKLTKDELMKVNEAGRGVMTSVAEVEQRLSGMAE